MFATVALATVLVALVLWAFISGRTHPPDETAVAAGLRSSALLQSASPPRGLWIPLLDEAPRVLHWPLVPQNSDRTYRGEQREFSLSSDQFAMMEMGRTTARDFRLRARLHQSAWTGDAGIFWGYQERDEERQRQYQTIWLQPYERSARQRRPFHATWKSVLVTPDGRTNADRALQSWRPPAPAGQEVDVEIIVRGGRLSQLLWDGKDVGKIECRDPTVEPGPDDGIGAFGVVVDGSTILIRNAAFYLFD